MGQCEESPAERARRHATARRGAARRTTAPAATVKCSIWVSTMWAKLGTSTDGYTPSACVTRHAWFTHATGSREMSVDRKIVDSRGARTGSSVRWSDGCATRWRMRRSMFSISSWPVRKSRMSPGPSSVCTYVGRGKIQLTLISRNRQSHAHRTHTGVHLSHAEQCRVQIVLLRRAQVHRLRRAYGIHASTSQVAVLAP